MNNTDNIAKTTLRSIIKKYFTPETLVDIFVVSLRSELNNNQKIDEIYTILKRENIPYNQLGPGTNRFAVQIDGYAVKFALDKDGQIDNRREFLYSKTLYPYVIKCYECTLDGLMMVCEYVRIFTIDDFYEQQENMRKILKEIARNYMVGDMGVTTKNYLNWGFRMDGSIVILDFAYTYKIKYTQFVCDCEGDQNILVYDNDYNNLICPSCGKKWQFKTVRRNITRADQEKEIGDISKIGYNLIQAVQTVNVVPEFEPITEEKHKKPKVEAELKDSYKPYKYEDVPFETYEEIMEKLLKGKGDR